MSGDGTGPGAKGPPTVAEQVAPQVAELHAQGHGRNEIARRLGVGETTVSRAAVIAGVRFDTTATQAATKSRSVQLAEQRADLAELSAELATKAGRRLRIELDAEVLDPTAVRALGTAFGITADKFVALTADASDATDEHAAAALWLEGLTMQIHAANEGLIPADENGNTPISFGPDDHNPNPNPLEST